MKKFLIFLLLALLPRISFAQDAEDVYISYYISYSYKGGPSLLYCVNLDKPRTVSLMGFANGVSPASMANITIPEEIKDENDETYTVNAIYRNAFRQKQFLKTVTIEANLSEIGNSAFSASGVTSVVFADGSVTKINEAAFFRADKLTTFTTAVAEPGKNVFPKGLENIDNYAFCGTNLAGTVVLNSDLGIIGEKAFADCHNITELAIGNTTVNTNAFDGCTSLKTVYSEMKNEKNLVSDWINNSNFTFYQNTTNSGYFDYEQKTSFNAPNIYYVKLDATSGEATITSHKGSGKGTASKPVAFGNKFISTTNKGKTYSVTAVGDGTNAVATDLVGVTLPSTLKTISANAFKGNTVLTSVAIPETVETIGANAFDGATALTSLALPSSLKEIGESAFARMTSLTSVTLPSGVTVIPDKLFEGSSSLTSLTVNGALTSIGPTPFTGTDIKELNLTFNPDYGFSVSESTSESITYDFGPVKTLHVKGAKTIGVFKGSWLNKLVLENCGNVFKKAFSNCFELEEVTLDVTSIGEYAFEGLSYITSLTLGNRLTSIGEGAFSRTSNLTEINLPSSLKKIGARAFYFTDLKSASLPAGVTEIPNELFYKSTDLEEIFIHGTISSLGSNSFGETKISTLRMTCSKDLEVKGSNLFSSNSPVITLYIKGAGTISDFTGYTNLRNLDLDQCGTVAENAFSGCEALKNVSLDVTSIGKSAFANAIKAEDSELNLSERVTMIGDGAFAGTGLTSAKLPASVTTIPANLFKDASSLTKLTVNGAVESIGTDAFTGTSITSLHLICNSGAAITGAPFDENNIVEKIYIKDAGTIGDFGKYSKLTSVELENCGTISPNAFSGCTALTTAKLDVKEIGASAFSGCNQLATVTMSDRLIKIGASAFKGTTTLTSVTLPSSLTTVEEGAFEGTGLTTATLPSLVTKIPADLFNGADKLASVTINGELTSIGATPFKGTKVSKLNLFFNSEYVFDNAGPVLDSEGTKVDTLYIKGAKTLSGNTKYTKLTSLVLDNCGTISEGAFSGWSGLESVTLDVTSVGKNAFLDCTNIQSITISNRVAEIGLDAFKSCADKLKQFTSQAVKAPSAATSFGNIDSTPFGSRKPILITPTESEGYDIAGGTVKPWSWFAGEHQTFTASFMYEGGKVGDVTVLAGQSVNIFPVFYDDKGKAVVIVVIFDEGKQALSNVQVISFDLPKDKNLTTWKSLDAEIDADNNFTMPHRDVVLNAFVTDKTYKMVLQYTKDGGDPVVVSSDDAVKIGTEIKFPTLPEFTGYEHPAWNKGDFKTGEAYMVPEVVSQEGFTMPDGNVELTVAYTAKEYTVTYKNGSTGTTIATSTHTINDGTVTITDDATLPDNETGKTWAWTSSDVTISNDKFTMPAKDVTITATATADTYTITYKYLMADSEGNTGTTQKKAPVVDSYTYDAVVTPASLSDLATSGYTVEWTYKDESGISVTPAKYADGTFKMPAMNLIAEPEYDKEKYTITFMANNVAIKVEEGDNVVPAEGGTYKFDNVVPTAIAGKTFTGWTSSDVTIAEGVDIYSGSFTMPAKSVTIVAKYEATKYKLTYYEINPVTLKETTTTSEVAAGTTVTVAKPTTTMVKYEDGSFGYFSGWIYISDEEVTETGGKFIMPSCDVLAIAGFDASTSKLTSHNLTIRKATDPDTDWHSIIVYTGQNIKDAIAASSEIDDLEKTGSTWALSDNSATISGAPTVMPDNDLTLYVHYTESKYTITYQYTKDGNTVTLGTYSYAASETVTPPTAPTFDGYSFSGWTSIPSPLTENITVTGSYTKNAYILTFEVDGEVYSKTENMAAGQAITVPAAPVKSGYTFSGWQWPDNKILSTMPAGNLTVSGYFYQTAQTVKDSESGLTFDVAVTGMNGNTGSVTLTAVPEAVLKGEAAIPSQISAGGKTYTVTKVAASAFDNLAEGVIIYLPETAVTTADVVNVVNNGSKVKTLDLSKVKKFALPSTVASVTASEVKYTRTITGSSTVVTMPYEVAVPKGFNAYTLKGANSQKKAQFEEYAGEKMAAYTPYLLVKQSGEVAAARALLADDAAAETETTIDLSAKNVTIVPEPESVSQGNDVELCGAVSAISNDRGYIFGMYKLQGDGSWKMTAVENDPSEYIAPFSGYLRVNNDLKVGEDGKIESSTGTDPDDPTGIDAVANDNGEMTNDKDVWYDMRGHRLQGEPTQKGIYIKNGKKYVKN